MNRLFAKALAGLLVLALGACNLGGTTSSNDFEDVHLQLGVRYLSMNKLELARENLQRALAKNSHNPQVHNALAFLYEKINQPGLAKEHYETALDLAPEDLGVKNNFGRFLCEHGKLKEGMGLLAEVSASPLNDRQWMAQTNAGRCQLSMGQKRMAENYFRQALQLNDSYMPALAEMQKLAYQNGDYLTANGYLQRYLAHSAHTAETLWFAMLSERALGNRALAMEYRNLLLEKFPLSEEAKKISKISDF